MKQVKKRPAASRPGLARPMVAPKATLDFRFSHQNQVNAPRSPLVLASAGKTSTGSTQFAFITPLAPAAPNSHADSRAVQNALAHGVRTFANKGAFFAGYDSLAGLGDQFDGGSF